MMLVDFFAPANIMTTIIYIAVFVFIGVIQYRLCLSNVNRWLQKLPMLLCIGASLLFIILFFCSFSNNAWHALSWFMYMLFSLILLIACIIGRMAARRKQYK